MTATFDPQTHQYAVNGRAVPSVTQVLDEAGLVDKTWYTDQARTRGDYVAQATALHDLNELNESSLDDALRPYLLAWSKFLLDSQFEPELIEHRMFDRFGRYAGTLDRYGLLRGDSPALIDIKTGGEARWHGLQLAGYQELLADKPVVKRLAVYLGNDGRYSCREYSEFNDFVVFRAALAVVTWKRNGK